MLPSAQTVLDRSVRNPQTVSQTTQAWSRDAGLDPRGSESHHPWLLEEYEEGSRRRDRRCVGTRENFIVSKPTGLMKYWDERLNANICGIQIIIPEIPFV